MKYVDLDNAIKMQNGVKQGLSSAIMTTNLREAKGFYLPQEAIAVLLM